MKKNYLTHRAILSIQFDVANGAHPEAVANEIVRDMIGDGYPVILDDVEDVKDGGIHDLRPSFTKENLEAGHGDAFRACFVFTASDDPEVFICESVDLMLWKVVSETPVFAHSDWVSIGAVGGEVEIAAVRNSDGSLNTEQMCRDWIGVWHRHFVGAVEDSVQGLFLMIKQTISEGKFNN